MRTVAITLLLILLAGCPPIEVDAPIDAKANTNITNTTINNNGEGKDSGVAESPVARTTTETVVTIEDAGVDLVKEDAGSIEADAGVEDADAGSIEESPPPPPPPACTIGQTVCNGNQVQACDGKKWVNGKFCTLGCNSGICNVCDPGATRCTGSGIETCIGTGWMPTTSCSYTCFQGACADQLCEPGALLCDQDGNVTKCGDNGVEWVAEETCDLGCTDGVCDACTEDTMSCEGKTTRLCVDGQWEAEDECPNGCALGVCTECQPGARQCSDHDAGTFAQVCDGTGHWVDDTECSGSTPFCTNGECGECNPGVTADSCLPELCEFSWGTEITVLIDVETNAWKPNCRMCDPSTDPTCVEVDKTPKQADFDGGCIVEPLSPGQNGGGPSTTVPGRRACYRDLTWFLGYRAGWFFQDGVWFGGLSSPGYTPEPNRLFHQSCGADGHWVTSCSDVCKTGNYTYDIKNVCI